ncbi:MAG: peptidyl-prolyl cis-trans isomerase, partial [Rubrivivax sp.]|nr:peptidyl-prolyl cis-trans isomerase [Pyrinomonadaceae bacterium]
MKSKFYTSATLSLVALLLTFAAVAVPSARAQEEGAPRIIDEVIAQVNTEVVTLSALRREQANAVQAIVQQSGGKMTVAQAEAEVAKRQAEMIATLVNEQLLVQKGKELGLTEEVEAEVNRRMLEVMKAEGFKTVQELETAMNAAGVSPAAVRQSLRIEIMKNFVLGSEVDRKIFWSLLDAEVKAYFEKHKDKFRKPETLTLSEIFLGTAGKDDAEVKARAQQIVQQLRVGGDFKAVAMVQSERENEKGQRVAPETGGKIGSFSPDQISHQGVAAAVKTLKAGQLSDPVKMETGYTILRMDERTPAGEAVYDERKVREAITVERLEKERRNYIDTLRREAYVDVAPSYRESVLPLLKT